MVAITILKKSLPLFNLNLVIFITLVSSLFFVSNFLTFYIVPILFLLFYFIFVLQYLPIRLKKKNLIPFFLLFYLAISLAIYKDLPSILYYFTFILLTFHLFDGISKINFDRLMFSYTLIFVFLCLCFILDFDLGFSTNKYQFILFILLTNLLFFFHFKNRFFFTGIFFIAASIYLSFLSDSRSALILSLVLGFIFAFYRYKISSLVFSLFLSFCFFEDLVIFFENFNDLKIFYDIRWELYSSYLDSLDAFNFLFGSYYPTIISDTFSSNPHNSFIRVHFMLGVFSLFLFIFYFYLYAFSLRSDHFVFFTLLLFIILIRAFFDSLLFFSIFDFFLISFLYIPIKYKERSNVFE